MPSCPVIPSPVTDLPTLPSRIERSLVTTLLGMTGRVYSEHKRATPGRPTHAVRMPAAASSPSSSMAASRILNFWILPVTVIGKPSTNFQ